MKDLTESVFASDSEEEAAAVRDCLTENNIKCTLNINTNNQLFGKGVLNSGEIISGGSFEIMVEEKDVETALQVLASEEENLFPGENNSDEESTDYDEEDAEILDKRYFVRAILLGFIHFLGFGTIAALISAWNISNKRKRFTALLVPAAWYFFVLINLFLHRPLLSVILFCINILTLIIIILSPKKLNVYLTVLISGLSVFSIAIYYFI